MEVSQVIVSDGIKVRNGVSARKLTMGADDWVDVRNVEELKMDSQGEPNSCSTTMIDDDGSDEEDEIEVQYDALDLMAKFSPEETSEILRKDGRIARLSPSMTHTVYLSIAISILILAVCISIERKITRSLTSPVPVVPVIATSASAESFVFPPTESRPVLAQAWSFTALAALVWDVVLRVLVLLFKY